MKAQGRSTPPKLELLVRSNRGRVEFKTYKDDLEKILGVDISAQDLLDLESTDQLFAQWRIARENQSTSSKLTFSKTWQYEPSRVWLSECLRVTGSLERATAVLFVGPYKYCGAVIVKTEQVLRSLP
jgi:hypothetical protein